MTKEELLDEEIVFSRANGYVSCISLHILNKFFETNVVIPKGENRHPYADVLHAYLEDTTLEIQGSYKESNFWKTISDFLKKEYRIKPQEPIYEWQWMYKFKNGNEFQFTSYQTEDEIRHFMSTIDESSLGSSVSKIEETKRVRQ